MAFLKVILRLTCGIDGGNRVRARRCARRPLQLLRKCWAGMEAEAEGRGLGQIPQDLRTKAKELGDEMTLFFFFF